MTNLVSGVLSSEDSHNVHHHIDAIKKLLPFSLKLTPQQRQALAKIDDTRVPFVEKCFQLGKQEPAIVPPYTDLDELFKDLELYKSLKLLEYELNGLAEIVRDTRTAAGSEAFVAALSIYNSAKGALKMGLQGSESIVDELKTHFEKESNTKEDNEEPANNAGENENSSKENEEKA